MPTDPLQALSDWTTKLDWQQDLVPWLLASMAIGIASGWLLWLLPRVSGRADRGLTRALHSPGGGLLAWLLRLAWLIGPGYVTLLIGLLSPSLMGLTQIDWGAPFVLGLGFAALSLIVLLAAGLAYRRSFQHHPERRSLPGAIDESVRLVLEAGGLQWHWAFYRCVAITFLQTTDVLEPTYWGTWLAVAIIALEGLLNPLLWRDLGRPGLAERRILRAILLIVTSVLYLISRNFWLAWAFHAASISVLEPRFFPEMEPGVDH
jgi:hypothetical protein